VLRERGFSDESLRRLQNGSPYSSKVTDYCLVRLLRKQCVNIVPIRNHILEIIGYGIYPTLSPIQHSCDPNCVVVFDELCAKLIAIRPICPNDLLTVLIAVMFKCRFHLFLHDMPIRFVMSMYCGCDPF